MQDEQRSYLVIIGAPKAGTTSLAAWLDQRPDMVLGTSKEPRFFTDFHGIDWQGPAAEAFKATMIGDESAYLASFAHQPQAAWAVDASTDYLWCAAAPGRIRAWADRYPTRLICILRDPVDRIVSEYQHTIRDHLQNDTLARSLELEETRFHDRWHPLFYHLRRSRYSDRVKEYHDLFGDDLLLLDFADMRDPDRCMRRIERFLGLAEVPVDRAERKNESYVYRNRLAAGLMGHEGLKSLGRTLVPPERRARVRGALQGILAKRYDYSEEEIAALRRLLAEEIRACRANPLINTSGWTTSEAVA